MGYNLVGSLTTRNRQQQQQQKSLVPSILRGTRRSPHATTTQRRRIGVILLVTIVLTLYYVYIRIIVLHVPTRKAPISDEESSESETSSKKKPSILEDFFHKQRIAKQSIQDNNNNNNNNNNNVNYFRMIAMELAKHTPSDILYELNEYDPFGVRTVVSQIQSIEQQNNNNNSQLPLSSLTLSQIQSLFPCPATIDVDSLTVTHSRQQQRQQRITLPELRNMTKLRLYQQQMYDILHPTTTTNTEKQQSLTTATTPLENYFIYFQHLRKAGGTHFCTIAQQNIPSKYLPRYYCMPDYDWSPPKTTTTKSRSKQQEKYQPCAGCLHRYSNNEIIQYMRQQQYKIAGNEWDNFRVSDHFELPAIYLTSFRQPLDRFVSQYRFECVEHRGCTANTIDVYWNRRVDLYNIYTSTFSDIHPQKQPPAGRMTTVASQQQRSHAVTVAFDTIVQFHVVLVMELLPYSEQLVQSVLGFRDTSILSQRVRPHNEGKNHRTDSWTPQEFLTPEQYTKMSESLALDEILYDVARRVFLERLVCTGQQ